MLADGMPGHLEAGCRALAQQSGCELLGLDFSRDGDEWVFVDATGCPSLFLGGERLIEALERALA